MNKFKRVLKSIPHIPQEFVVLHKLNNSVFDDHKIFLNRKYSLQYDRHVRKLIHQGYATIGRQLQSSGCKNTPVAPTSYMTLTITEDGIKRFQVLNRKYGAVYKPNSLWYD